MIPAETLLLAGPTGAGKTALSLRLAQRLAGEIVGADAFQLYRGLPLLTAQPSSAELGAIPHHLVGCIDPSETYDAGRYTREAAPVLQDIALRGRRPLLVGGTGLYLKALLGGLDELPESDPQLRTEFAELSLPELVARLHAADPEAATVVDLRNRRRVERALEIILLTGKPLAASRTGGKPIVAIRGLILTRDREELNARIARNVEAMFSLGVEREVAALPEECVGPTASGTLGLREIRSLLRGEISREAAIEQITLATRRYAKRQMTWFRNQHDFPVLNLSLFPDPAEAEREALRLLGVS